MTVSIWSDHTNTEKQEYEALVHSARNYLLSEIKDKAIDFTDETTVSRKLIDFLQNTHGCNFQTANAVKEDVLVDIKGYGVIDPLIHDPHVSDIFVHKHDDITYERFGQLHDFDGKFRDQQHLMMFIEKLALLSRARIDISNPMATITLPEGYRTAVTIPPVSLHPTIAIRKFVSIPSVDELIKNGYFSQQAGEFFKAAIHSKRNMLIIGGMGTGSAHCS